MPSCPTLALAARVPRTWFCSPLFIVLGVALVGLPGCSTLPHDAVGGRGDEGSRAGFAAYSERVFRYHNRLVDELIVATEMSLDDPAADLRLVRAEHAMADACAPLNAIASARLEGRTVGLWQRLGLLRAVPHCERASDRVARFLGPAL